MRWIIGIDFEGRSRGALHMAAWLRQQAPNEPQEFVGVHVLPDRLRRMIAAESVAGAPASSAEEMRRVVEASGVPDPLSETSVPWASTAEDGLALAAATANATAILIGRATPTDTRGLDRLGRVARRLLRALPAPVMVVPPDHSITSIGKGPIVLATDLDAASLGAARLARSLAQALHRELLVVSVDAAAYEAAMLAPHAFVPLFSTPSRTTEQLRTWMDAHGLGDARARVAGGERVATLLAVATESDAALVVCGSRRLSLGERIFASSTATSLARSGNRAVLVVPANEGEIDPS